MGVVGESITFGRFMSESEALSWEKWSTFSHKKYVEEAARYAQPGSVAQKKAFFEAHYKKIAAQKAAAAAALLEQENAAREEADTALQNASDDKQVVTLNSAAADDDDENSWVGVITGNEGSELRISVSLSENIDSASCSEGDRTPQMERPLLKESCVGSEDISLKSNKKSSPSSLKSSIRRKTWRVPSTPIKPVTPHFNKENNVSQIAKKSSVGSMDKKIPTPKTLRRLVNLVPIKEADKAPVSVSKKASSSGHTPGFSTTPKNCRTPLVEAAKGVAKYYSTSTPLSENKSYTKSFTSCRNKLPSPASSTPFMLRTEERAAKRKQKLEQKFNTVEEQQLRKTLKEKAGNEIKKLSYSFCFKARPLPDFYKQIESPINQTTTVVLGRSNSKKQHATVSMPQSSKKNVANPTRLHTVALPQRTAHENKSPNIQHSTRALSHKIKLK